jgi:hypothetical protein
MRYSARVVPPSVWIRVDERGPADGRPLLDEGDGTHLRELLVHGGRVVPSRVAGGQGEGRLARGEGAERDHEARLVAHAEEEEAPALLGRDGRDAEVVVEPQAQRAGRRQQPHAHGVHGPHLEPLGVEAGRDVVVQHVDRPPVVLGLARGHRVGQHPPAAPREVHHRVARARQEPPRGAGEGRVDDEAAARPLAKDALRLGPPRPRCRLRHEPARLDLAVDGRPARELAELLALGRRRGGEADPAAAHEGDAGRPQRVGGREERALLHPQLEVLEPQRHPARAPGRGSQREVHEAVDLLLRGGEVPEPEPARDVTGLEGRLEPPQEGGGPGIGRRGACAARGQDGAQQQGHQGGRARASRAAGAGAHRRSPGRRGVPRRAHL